MLGGSSIRLATIFGIRVGVHVTWFVVLFLFIYWLNGAFDDTLDPGLAFWTAVAAAFGFFGSILLHELGHALTARREGIQVSGIDLFFFGGVMKMGSDTRSPGQEFRIAIAGPLVTLAIIVVAALGSTALLGWQGFVDSATLDNGADTSAFDLWLSFLVSMNVLLLLFNLIPAFPLDGGRIARAAVEHAAVSESGTMPVRDIVAGADDRVRFDAPLEALLGSEPLRRLGALMAVDAEGRLRGVVTVEQVTRALRSRLELA